MSNSSRNIENYKELLEPTRDPEEAINVDIAGTLRNFMDDSAQEGNMNFNTAALLVQGSATVYGKKVDCLYKMTMDLCDKLKNLGKEDEVTKDVTKDVTEEEKPKPKKRERLTRDGHPVFISTEIKTSSNLSCLGQKNQEKWKDPKQYCGPPPHLMPATEEERGAVMYDTSGESVGRCGDFALNRSTLTSSGWMLLGHVSPSLIPQDDEDEDEKDDGMQDIAFGTYFNMDEPEASDVDENKRKDSFPEDSECKPMESDGARVLTDEQLHKLIRSIIRSATKKEDKPEPVKPKKGERPVGKNKNIRSLPAKLKRKGAPKPLLNISYYCNFTFSHTDKNDLGSKIFEANRTFLKRLKETAEFLDTEFAKFKKEKRIADEKRKSSNDKENPDGAEEKPNDDEDKPEVEEILDDDDDVDDDDIDDDDDDESDVSESADVDSAENIAHSDNEDVDVDIVMEPEMISESRCKIRAIPSTSKASQPGGNSGSFKNLTEAYMDDIRKYVRQNDMTERVNAWQREVKPRVDAVVSRGPFNITEYMSHILNAFREDNSKQTIVFREFCRGKEKYEIHRYFMALMTLASDQNISIATEPRGEDCDEIFITLCSRKMHHEELESFGHSVGSHK